MDPHRFGLEVRSVLVSWRAGVRSLGDDGEARESMGRRALELLDDVERRYPEVVDDEASRSHLQRAREEIADGGAGTG